MNRNWCRIFLTTTVSRLKWYAYVVGVYFYFVTSTTAFVAILLLTTEMFY